jgi:hypothetical protein
MFNRLNTTSSSKFFCTWKIMTFMSRFFDEFTFIKSLRKTRQWWRNLLSLKMNWRCSYEINFVSMKSCKMIFFENIFRDFFLMRLSFSRRIFRCCKDNEIWAYQRTYIRKWSIKSTEISSFFKVYEKIRFVMIINFSFAMINSKASITCSRNTMNEYSKKTFLKFRITL